MREKKELAPVNNSSDASTNEDKDLDHILINIDIPNIRFSKVMFILVEPWEGKGSIKKSLERQIVKSLESIEQEGIK
jgi:hypothetical protein